MTSDPVLYAAVLRLSRHDIKALRITDAYSVHRVVYSLFTDTRDEEQKRASHPSGILYADKGGDFRSRKILLLANRLPNLAPPHGTVEYKPIPRIFSSTNSMRLKSSSTRPVAITAAASWCRYATAKPLPPGLPNERPCPGGFR